MILALKLILELSSFVWVACMVRVSILGASCKICLRFGLQLRLFTLLLSVLGAVCFDGIIFLGWNF